ncbi:MAG: WbqC family protein [Chloroflexi bacterium]|nr:WbqC family protein [Chloroflexota bacterium]
MRQKMKIVTMHQPNYLPWIGLFSKISLADCLLIYDDAQYEKNCVINRNKIRTDKGSEYLTIPVGRCPTETRISDVNLPQNQEWKQHHWRRIHDNYVKTPFFNDYAGFFEDLYREDLHCLCDLNEKILSYLLWCFKINVEVIKTSRLNLGSCLQKTDLMIAYLKRADADVYLSGPSGKSYLEIEKFPENNIALRFFKFQHPVYRQRYIGFEPNMSAIDLLFNMGPQSGEVIRSSASMEDCEYGRSVALVR